MAEELIQYIHYQEMSKIIPESLVPGTIIHILFDKDNINTVMIKLKVLEKGRLFKEETYQSLREFSSTSMKETLLLFAKRSIIALDTTFFSEDDPKLHSFLSKLSYTGIETVCKNIPEFATQFKAGHITLKLPKTNPKPRK